MVCVNEGALPLFIVVLWSGLQNIPWDPACNRRGGGTRRRHVVARGESYGGRCHGVETTTSIIVRVGVRVRVSGGLGAAPGSPEHW